MIQLVELVTCAIQLCLKVRFKSTDIIHIKIVFLRWQFIRKYYIYNTIYIYINICIYMYIYIDTLMYV